MSRRIIIVGHGVAGLTAGEALRTQGFDGDLTVIGQEPHAPYSRPALSKGLLVPPGDGSGSADAELQPQYLASAAEGTEVLSGRSAVSLDPAARTVLLDDGRALAFDGLVIATGAGARRFTNSPDEFTLRGLDDARALRRRLADRPHVTVIGGGPLGMEVASSARAAGCEVTLVHRGLPMRRQMGELLATVCAEAALEHGVHLVDAGVTEVSTSAGPGLTLHLDSGQSMPAEVVVSAIGDFPHTDWLTDSGLLSGGRLVTNEQGMVAPGIVAAGDVSWRQHGTGDFRRALWTDAIEEAKTAAAALLHGPAITSPEPTPYFWTEQFGLNVRITGTIPPGSTPLVHEGALAERRAVLHWPAAGDGTAGGAAASLNVRIPIPRLRRLAASAVVAA